MRYFYLFLIVLLAPGLARANCTDPDSVAGGMIYNADYQTMQFCDGAQWWSMKGGTVGPLKVTTSNEACNSSMEGGLRYNSTTKIVEICNGASWNSIIITSDAGMPSTPPASAGYFVVTSATYNGNLGGITGANSKCLTDLNGHDWNGKTDATTRGIITSGHVRAWLCDMWNGVCQDAIPGVTYYFAVSGDNTKGGASFTADGSGRGPGNTQNWSGTNYFDGSKQYWTGRATGTSTLWGEQPVDEYHECYQWANNQSTSTGTYGVSLNAGTGRWDSADLACNTTQHLVCFVDP